MNRGLHFVAHKVIFVHYVNKIYGNFIQPGQKLLASAQGVWPCTPWCSAATANWHIVASQWRNSTRGSINTVMRVAVIGFGVGEMHLDTIIILI